MDHARLVDHGFVRGHLGVRDQDDNIVFLYQMGCRAVDADDSRTAVPGYGLGLKSVAVCYIDDGNKLARKDIGGFKEVQVHGDGTNVVKISVRDGGTMDFGLENRSFHMGLPKFVARHCGNPHE